MWVVYATPPSLNENKPWDFRDAYFPRHIYYKKDALILAQEAKDKGGKDVRIEKLSRL